MLVEPSYAPKHPGHSPNSPHSLKLTQLRVQILICTLPHPPLIMNRISEAHILEQDLDRTQDRLTKQHVHLTGTHAQLEVSSSLGANINMYT